MLPLPKSNIKTANGHPGFWAAAHLLFQVGLGYWFVPAILSRHEPD
jgi:hypothetical protein